MVDDSPPGDANKTVRIWNPETGQDLLTFKGHTKEVMSVAFRPDGRRLASASNDGTIKIWDPGTGQETANSHRTWGRCPNRGLQP